MITQIVLFTDSLIYQSFKQSETINFLSKALHVYIVHLFSSVKRVEQLLKRVVDYILGDV